MARLTLIADVLRGGRRHIELQPGANLGEEMRRVFPDGVDRGWALYVDRVSPSCLLPYRDHPTMMVRADARYFVVVPPGAGLDVVALGYSLLVSLALSAITHWLTPKPRKARSQEEDNSTSPNNQLAAQTNVLRPGARVPDILGRVRAYPDLLCNPVEFWERRQQTIIQLFCLGKGDYDINETRLGDTPTNAIPGCTVLRARPTTPDYHGDPTAPIQLVKTSPEVHGISLFTEDEADVPAVETDFAAGPKTMTLTEYMPIPLGTPIHIAGSSFNDGLRWVDGVPLPTQTEGPWVYTLDGPVVDESDANPAITIIDVTVTANRWCYFGGARPPVWEAPDPPDTADIIVIDGIPGDEEFGVALGTLLKFTVGGQVFRGVTNYNFPIVTVEGMAPFFEWHFHDTVRLLDTYGNPVNIIPGMGYVATEVVRYTGLWSLAAMARAALAAPTPRDPGDPVNAWTAFYTVPMEDPTEIWLDFAFPQGLLYYYEGVRYSLPVSITAEFRRVGGGGEVSRTWVKSDSTSGALRWTWKLATTTLGFAPGGGRIEVRVRSDESFRPDTTTTQFVQDTRWERLAAMVWSQSFIYPDVTTLRMTMVNKRSAFSMGETSLNAIVTRRVRTWTGSEWLPATGTERWADNLVERMKATDGASRIDAEIDLAGIYEIQATLDAMDGGEQGKISMTLDTLQDIDTELQLIAGLVRGTLYRVGRKLHVVRDEGGKIPLALFTGRSKAPAGETVTLSMVNDGDYDAIIVQWINRASGWKLVEFQWPPASEVTALNPLRIAPPLANWAQAYRRALYEWYRLTLRRDSLQVEATEEARLIYPGDVVHVADDVANLAQTAGELVAIEGLTLTLDLPVDLSAGGFTIMLRDTNGRDVDAIPVSAGGSARQVVLSRGPVVAIKPRDDYLGTIYALFQTQEAVIRPWLVTGIEPGTTYTRLIAENWREDVYAGDSVPLPGPDPEVALLTIASSSTYDRDDAQPATA